MSGVLNEVSGKYVSDALAGGLLANVYLSRQRQQTTGPSPQNVEALAPQEQAPSFLGYRSPLFSLRSRLGLVSIGDAQLSDGQTTAGWCQILDRDN